MQLKKAQDPCPSLLNVQVTHQVFWRRCGDTAFPGRNNPRGKNSNETTAACRCFSKMKQLWIEAEAMKEGPLVSGKDETPPLKGTVKDRVVSRC